MGLAVEMALRHPARTWVTIACLVAVLTPFLSALAVLEGVRAEAGVSLAEGPDLFVTGYEYGRSTPIPQSLVSLSRELSCVLDVRGRIIGRSTVGSTLLTVVGLGPSRFRNAPAPGEVWLGSAAARAIKLAVGGELTLADLDTVRLRVSRVLPDDAGLASSRLALVSLADAQTAYATPGQLTDLQVWLHQTAGLASDLLKTAAHLRSSGMPLRIQTRKLVEDYVDRGLTLKGGSFLALYLVALGLAIPALLVTTGFGLTVRRQEIGLFKALGFTTVDVLEVAVWESVGLSLVAALSAFLVSWLWIRVLGGFLIAGFFVAGLEHGPLTAIPARFCPDPLLIATGFSFVLLATGAVPTSYRAATVSPVEALQ